jgi:hypothetical protein
VNLMTKSRRRERLTWDDVELLGDVGGWRYVAFAGEEFILDRTPLDAGHVAQPLADDGSEIRIVEAKSKLDFGTRNFYNSTTRGERVPPGAYEAALAKVRRPAAPKPMQPVDMLGRLPRFARRPGRVVSAPGPVSRYTQPPEPEPSVRNLIASLERAGIELTLTPGGGLRVRAPGGRLIADDLAAIERFELLIVGVLGGKPLRCAEWHGDDAPEAVTVGAVNVPMCQPHADGSLPIAATSRTGGAS